MEGTVTISLKDYEKLKKCKEKEKYYSEFADRYVNLLEGIEYEGEVSFEMLNKINLVLSEWYG